jgi:hypothetical protein
VAHQVMANGSFELKRVHSNLHLHGDIQFPHWDLSGGMTALYYANSDWHENSFGETVFMIAESRCTRYLPNQGGSLTGHYAPECPRRKPVFSAKNRCDWLPERPEENGSSTQNTEPLPKVSINY